MGVRILKQNASEVIEDVIAGQEYIVTLRGEPVARLSPLETSLSKRLVAAGLASPPKTWPPVFPERATREISSSQVLDSMRED